MPRYNHQVAIAFSIENDSPDGDLTYQEVMSSLYIRCRELQRLPVDEAMEAFQVIDTYEITN